MKLPVVSGKDTVKAFGKLGYVTVRQTGSHIRMKHHPTILKNRSQSQTIRLWEKVYLENYCEMRK